MPLWPQFVGGAYQARSPTLSAEACINLFPITLASATNAKKSALMGTPGLRRIFGVSTSSCRGMFSEDGRTFAVIGATLYELDLTANTATSRGAITDDGQPVSFASNGRGGEQLAICGGGELTVLDLLTNTLSAAVTLPLTNAPVMIAFLDGYGLLLEADTVRCWFSALEDFESWDALDYFARNQTSDNFVGLTVFRDRVWLFGSRTTEVYYDSGNADTPFLPYPGAILHEGCLAPWSITNDGTNVFWLAGNDHGHARFVKGQEGQAQPISTDAIDFWLAQAPRLDDTEVLTYWQEGRSHLCWTVPTACDCGRTYCWIPEESQWYEAAEWDQTLGQFYRWRARGVCATAQGIICGDYADANLYVLDLDTFTNNGSMIRRVRRAPYLSAEAQYAFIDAIELGAQVGIGLSSGQGSEPTVLARISRDGGQTWTPSVSARLGAQGQYGTRCVWHRLGRLRLDRLVLEIVVTDPVRIVFGPGLQLRLTAGTAAA